VSRLQALSRSRAPKIVKRFGGTISVRVAHLPLRSHPHAMKAAVAAECAGSQGGFSEFLERAYQRQSLFDNDSIWLSIAREADVHDTDRFAECMARDDRSAVARSLALAEAAGIRATPTLLINGWRDLAVPLERSVSKALKGMVDSLEKEQRRAR
jgi:protein-disulfide isomerase